jgi:hypothetical protein
MRIDAVSPTFLSFQQRSGLRLIDALLLFR